MKVLVNVISHFRLNAGAVVPYLVTGSPSSMAPVPQQRSYSRTRSCPGWKRVRRPRRRTAFDPEIARNAGHSQIGGRGVCGGRRIHGGMPRCGRQGVLRSERNFKRGDIELYQRLGRSSLHNQAREAKASRAVFYLSPVRTSYNSRSKLTL